MNCQFVQNKIDESFDRKNLSIAESRHLETCAACRRFLSERERLGEMLLGLEKVRAPNDFNFRLKARLRETEAAPQTVSRQKMLWLAPTTLAALVCGFVFVQQSAFVNQPENNVATSTPTPINVERQPESAALPDSPKEIVAVAAAPPVVAQNYVENRSAGKRRAPSSSKAVVAAAPKSKTQNRQEKISSILAGVKHAPVISASRGIPHPLQTPKKLSGKELLRTYGIETVEESETLRVVAVSAQAARSGLQKDDVIRKINEEAPTNLSKNSFRQMNLVVRRQTEEIVVPLKP